MKNLVVLILFALLTSFQAWAERVECEWTFDTYDDDEITTHYVGISLELPDSKNTKNKNRKRANGHLTYRAVPKSVDDKILLYIKKSMDSDMSFLVEDNGENGLIFNGTAKLQDRKEKEAPSFRFGLKPQFIFGSQKTIGYVPLATSLLFKDSTGYQQIPQGKCTKIIDR